MQEISHGSQRRRLVATHCNRTSPASFLSVLDQVGKTPISMYKDPFLKKLAITADTRSSQ